LLVDTCHWNVGAGVPVAAPVNVAVPLDVSVTFPGCVVIAGATVTVSVAFELFTPAGATEFVATHRNKLPFCATNGEITVNVAVVTLAKLAPFATLLKLVPPFVDTCHWNVGAGFPVTATGPNVAFPLPCTTAVLAGCVVNAGAKFTVKVALLLAVVPVVLTASARNSHPFSVEFVASADNVAVATPVKLALVVRLLKITPPFVDTCHWNVVPTEATETATGPKVAVAPAVTVGLDGCVVNTGACPYTAPAAPPINSASAISRRMPRPLIVNRPQPVFELFFMGLKMFARVQTLVPVGVSGVDNATTSHT
jgi:hypothetical protein